MAHERENKPEQEKQAENKTAEEQQNKQRQQRESFNEDKFTWQPGDVKVYDSIDQIPGFKPFPAKNKKKDEEKKDEENKSNH